MRNIVIQVKDGGRAGGPLVELCEHKGVGHPDTLTDGACEAACRALCAAYVQHYGTVQHFNVDKGLLIAGASVPKFGGGAVTVRPRLIVCGRATPLPAPHDIESTVCEAVRNYLRDAIRCPEELFEVVAAIRPGSAALTGLFGEGRARRLANDTSFGVGYAPLSALEEQVLTLGSLLRSAGFREAVPAAGDDFKIMGVREGNDMRFTVALAFRDRFIDSIADYFAAKHSVISAMHTVLPSNCTLQLNCLDDPAATSAGQVYLTVTGLSAEMGDDGQVGRGNRVNGLITPARTMSLEAAAGKNPSHHVGKLYNVAALLIAREVVRQVGNVREASVQLLSTIGAPVDEPQIALVEVACGENLSSSMREQIAAIADERLGRLDELSQAIAAGAIPVF